MNSIRKFQVWGFPQYEGYRSKGIHRVYIGVIRGYIAFTRIRVRGFPKIWGTFFRGSHNKGHNILGSLLGSPNFWDATN